MASTLKNRLSDKLQAMQPELMDRNLVTMPVPAPNATVTTEENIVNMPTTPNTAAAKATAGYMALTTNALDIFKENLKNQPLSFQLFDTVKSPTGGATAFSVPGLAGDNIVKELTGIILDFTTPRAYWDTPDPVEGVPPICHSRDSVISFEGRPCSQCTFNDYGSKNGDTSAKACKESVAIFLLRPDNILPIIVRVPVTSKLKFLKYTTRLVGNLNPICGVVTRITLEKATSKAGQPYAMYNFEAIKTLTKEETANVRIFSQRFIEAFTAVADNDIELQKAS